MIVFYFYGWDLMLLESRYRPPTQIIRRDAMRTRSSAVAVIADCTAYDVTTCGLAIQTGGWNSRGQHEYLII